MADKRGALQESRRRLRHRGPDSEGYWEDPQQGVALAHVRLAILDLSEAGHQPMASACGRYTLVLNGEIYNHLALRAQLEQQGAAPSWRGHSDTETLVAAIAAWGLEQALRAAVGMYALAVWDGAEHALMLARDRLGEKPLYLARIGASVAFASELKALTCLPGFDAEPDRDALALLMRHNYIPAPYSIYRCARKLPAGTWVRLDAAQLAGQAWPEPRAYWSALEAARTGQSQPLAFDDDEAAVDALADVLGQAVRGQMMADVPLGAFLSGGIDSSVIVALMQAAAERPVHTFSIGFDDPAYDEAAHARAVAAHLGTQHTELYVTADDALAQVPRLAGIYDEPFADASQIPTLLVSRMARRHVTVSLSGDGGDELFGGYSRYMRASAWWRRREAVPAALRQPLGALAGGAACLVPQGRTRDQLAKLRQVLQAAHAGEFYRHFVTYWPDPAQVVIGAGAPATVFDEPMPLPWFEQMLLLDAVSYMPDDILVKVDRAAMAASLETRVPMLDHRVFEFAQRLPRRYRMRDGQGKWLLRQLLYRHVPRALIDRPKKGFSVPLADWLRGPLRPWAQDLLDPALLRAQGLFHPDPIARKWQEHLQGRRNWAPHLWSVLMTQAWLQHGQGPETP